MKNLRSFVHRYYVTVDKLEIIKYFILFLWLVAICMFLSCKKNDNIFDNSIAPTPTPVTIIDSLPFPLKTGTWWKYHREDTTIAGGPLGPEKLKTDTSTEIITVQGKITITDSVQAFMLEVKNLTSNKKDTNYAFYYRTNFIVSTTFPQNLSVYAENKYLGGYDLRFRLPLVEGRYTIPYNTNKGSGSGISDSVIIKKDTLLTFINNTYPGSTYAWEKYFYFGGAYSNGANSESVLVKNIGFTFWLAGTSTSNHYGIFSNNWFVRRLIDYYIAP